MYGYGYILRGRLTPQNLTPKVVGYSEAPEVARTGIVECTCDRDACLEGGFDTELNYIQIFVFLSALRLETN